MAQKSENVIQRIKQVRKLRRRTIHDCASFLNITKEQYIKFEEGIAPISLPEIELLAIFLSIPLNLLFENSPLDEDALSLLSARISPQFINLRHKMIRAKLLAEKKNRAVTIDEIQNATKIPRDDLEAYETGQRPIPLDHLMKISDFLSLPIQTFLNGVWYQSDDLNKDQHQTSWQPEYPKNSKRTRQIEKNPYSNLLEAIKSIPKKDQAQVAKILLEKIRSLQKMNIQ